MSKGDRIEVQAVVGNVPGSLAITASKAGRTVRHRQTTSKVNGRWLVVEELTRNGGKTGCSVQIRLDTVVAIIEERVDVPEVRKAKPRSRPVRKSGAEPLLLPLDEIATEMGVPEGVLREALATSHPDASPSEVEWRANEIMEETLAANRLARRDRESTETMPGEVLYTPEEQARLAALVADAAMGDPGETGEYEAFHG